MSALDYLFSLPRFTDQGVAAYQPGLERMGRLMAGMGNPHQAFRSIHVGGTNGKGSTASFIAAIATAGGKRTGLHTSPHLFDLCERMRVDGVPAGRAWLEDAVERYRPLLDEVRPSFFEATVALSFLHFAERQVDIAVVEVGLGGRLDATNVITPELAVITTIGLEHTDILGNTLGAIAREKGGIIKPGVPVVTAVAEAEPLEIIRKMAGERGAPLHEVQQEVTIRAVNANLTGLSMDLDTPVRSYNGLGSGLGGPYQQWNAALAICAAEVVLGADTDARPVFTGVREVRKLSGIRGRMDVLQTEPLIIADVGHNADGLAATLEALRPAVAERGGRLVVIFGAMRDKDIARMGQLLAAAGADVFALSAGGDRALPARELGEALRFQDVKVGGCGTVAEGMGWFQSRAFPGDVLLVTGSHQVVAQLRLERNGSQAT